jgi:putative DNA primase/helicase
MMRPYVLELFHNARANGANRYLASCPTPAHKYGDRHQSLSITIAPDGTVLLHCFAGCETRDICAAIGLELKDLFARDLARGHRPIYKLPEIVVDKGKQERLEQTWDNCRPLDGSDFASKYLQARGLQLNSYPNALRWHPQTTYYKDRVPVSKHPVMVARVEHPKHGLTSLHRTYLSDDGKAKANIDAPKKLSASVFEGANNGAAIRLFESSEMLALSEGVETALAVYQLTSWPVWSCVSAVGLERVLIPYSVGKVVICADNDAAGKNAANALAERLLDEGKDVRLAVPPPIPSLKKTDWLDVLVAA